MFTRKSSWVHSNAAHVGELHWKKLMDKYTHFVDEIDGEDTVIAKETKYLMVVFIILFLAGIWFAHAHGFTMN